MTLMLALLSLTATCTPDPALANAGPQRVRDYIAAINTRDPAAVGRFIKPGAVYSSPVVASDSLVTVVGQLLAMPHVEPLEVVEANVYGGGVFLRTRTRSNASGRAIIELDGGCITRFTLE